MFLEMQDFDFAQILSNLPKFRLNFSQSNQICPYFASILSKSNQIFPDLINF